MASVRGAVVGDKDPLITYTVFPNVQAREKKEYADAAWADVVRMIANPVGHMSKQSCPLLSLCEYGDLVSDGGGLRHAANVKRVYGIEVDYDGEEVTPEEGLLRLQSAGLVALIYTSASYTEGAPRWRALLPLSEPAVPAQRAVYVARANFALGGIASRESFTLSQSFYFGAVRGAKYKWFESHGRCVDQAVDLALVYHQAQGTDPKTGRDTRSNQQLIEAFARGEGRYEAMLKLSSRWAARGMDYDDVVTALTELLDSSGSSLNADGVDLRSRIEPMAASAVRKFGGTMPDVRLNVVPEPPKDMPEVDIRSYENLPEAQGMEIAYEPDAAVAQTERQADGPVVATFWQPVDPKSIPPREWLYGFHYMRRMVNMTAGAGGGGKSSVVMVEAISMAIGRDLLLGKWQLPTGPLRVWIHNGEDPLDEINRRLAAICLHYEVDPREVAKNLLVTSGRDTRIIVAEEVEREFILRPHVTEQVIQEIQDKGISVLILDPFVSTHAVQENNNPLMEKVLWEWRHVADRTGCSVEIVHHFRKGNGNEVSADDVRGATAIIGACRSVRVVSAMSKPEAEQYGVDPKERRRYFWLQNPKANMRPPTDERTWRYMETVELGNATGIYTEGDRIGVPREWIPPTAENQITPGQRAIILRELESAAMKDPLANRIDPRSSLWAGRIVARHLEFDPDDKQAKQTIKQILEGWVADGTLKRSQARDHAKGRYCPVFKVAEAANEAGEDEEVPF